MGVYTHGDNFLGIDPGSKGGATLLGADGSLVATVRFDGECPGRIAANLAQTAIGGNTHIAIERVGAAPGQGVSSMFTFGVGVGLIKGWLAANGFTHVEVSPQSWQKIATGDGETTKERARALASSLWGLDRFVFKGCRVPHQGCIDAAVLAEYLRRTMTGALPPIAPSKPTKRRRVLKLD